MCSQIIYIGQGHSGFYQKPHVQTTYIFSLRPKQAQTLSGDSLQIRGFQ